MDFGLDVLSFSFTGFAPLNITNWDIAALNAFLNWASLRSSVQPFVFTNSSILGVNFSVKLVIISQLEFSLSHPRALNDLR